MASAVRQPTPPISCDNSNANSALKPTMPWMAICKCWKPSSANPVPARQPGRPDLALEFKTQPRFDRKETVAVKHVVFETLSRLIEEECPAQADFAKHTESLVPAR